MAAALIVLPACELGAGDRGSGLRVPVGTPRTEQGPVVGLVGTMTGPGAWRGDDAFEGADLGVNVLNRSLPARQEPYELVTLDDRGDPARALALVERLAAEHATVGLVYAGPPEVLSRAEDALAEAGVPAILCFGDLPGALRGFPSHLFQASPPMSWQAKHLAAYILQDRAFRTTGLLMERSPSGRDARRSLQRALSGAGGRRAEWVGYRPGADNLPELLARLRRRRVEALVVGGGPGLVKRLEVALRRMGALYRSTEAARIRSRADARRAKWWKPQVLLFDLGLTPGTRLPPGTVAAESYARGAHYLPLPGFERWRSAFVDWWDAEPLGWELRAYQAVGMIGWAAGHSQPDGDLASSLEAARGVRFGGMAASFSPLDHLSVEPGTVGLWAIPRPGIRVPERGRLPGAMPWVPLGRTFDPAALGAGDARHLWARRPNGSFRPRFGISTSRSDPVH
ncbi:MAG: ABC transporter substrate-binding protein [Actinomycetota bacterium]|nr:ABC transporter substrate-binding protein [Actinomycetota bacterium]